MYEQIATDFLGEWAIKVSIISNQLTETINAIREKDRECNIAFLEFHDVIKEIYEDFYRVALPNRVIRHKKAFGL